MSVESIEAAPTVSFDPGSQEFAWHAYEHYARLRDQSPVHRLLQPDGTEVWLVTRYEDARAALADPRLSKNAQSIQRALKEALLASPGATAESHNPNIFFAPPQVDINSSDPPEHTSLRRLVLQPESSITYSSREWDG